jgi:hypothetical protein
LSTDVFAQDTHLTISTFSTTLVHVIHTSVVNIVENTVCHKNDDTEQADTFKRVELPAISEAMRSATRLYNLHPKQPTSDNSKIAKQCYLRFSYSQYCQPSVFQQSHFGTIHLREEQFGVTNAPLTSVAIRGFNV